MRENRHSPAKKLSRFGDLNDNSIICLSCLGTDYFILF